MKPNKDVPKAWQTDVAITVPFYDVDLMEIAWHGNYIKYFEVARCQLLDQLNSNYVDQRKEGIGWPVVDIRVKYVRPAMFNQKIIVHAKIVEWEMRLKIEYCITDANSGEVLTKGHSVQVAIDIKSREMLFATPELFRKNLQNAKTELS